MIRTATLFTVALPVLCHCAAAPAQPAESQPTSATLDRPPKPDFERPVDYLKWYRVRRCEPDWPSGREIYEALFTEDAVAAVEIDDDLERRLRIAAGQPWLRQARPDVKDYDESVRPYLDALDKAATHTDVCWDGDPVLLRWVLDGPSPKHRILRALMRARLASAWEQSGEQGVEAASLVRAWTTLFRTARHARNGGGLVPLLTSVAIDAATFQNIRQALAAEFLSVDDIERTLALIPKDGLADLSDAYRFEWAVMLDLAQRLYPNGRFSAEAAIELDLGKFAPWMRYVLPLAEETVGRVDAFYAQYVGATQRPWSLAEYANVRRADDLRPRFVGFNVWMIFTDQMAPTYRLAMRPECDRRATMLLLLASRFQQREGRWPHSLDEFASGAIRIDPFSSGDFVYELRDGQPWLYTVSFDGEDNGGKHDPTWAEDDPGHDYVYFPVNADE